MNKEIKKEWVAALRSGDYKQGRGSLRHNDAYCCLGVLCELHAKNTEGEFAKGLDGEWAYFADGVGKGVHYPKKDMPPRAIMDWAGLDRNGVTFVTINGRSAELPTHNDSFDATFDKIADAIEAQL